MEMWCKINLKPNASLMQIKLKIPSRSHSKCQNKTKLQEMSKNRAGVRGFPARISSIWRPVDSIFGEISGILEIASDRFEWLENHLKLVSKASESFLDQS